MLIDELKRLKLVTGRGKQSALVNLGHAGRLKGGLSVSLRATPDEVIGPLTFAMGGEAKTLRVLDVRTGLPLVVEIQAGELTEKWELIDVPALAHNLNDLYRTVDQVKVVAVLGEWDDMLQLWCVEKSVLPRLLERRVLDSALNAQTLWKLASLSESA